ncbi:hypothetical protein PLESTB_001060400 [Pleodorina starrii]|uniref:Uncharacterized protein n=1 Tax=Pleodorina starrii TaxID=330485 RepID=A0A9W6BQS3_9CHLO|nr:hypothetical protein PLESTM_001278000 [Pleodorina starrii]GLC56062.1 hypothetical protein PLESTB_001060400 [Pleodorina starrii]GLC64044.1 hypothetical protein PLESTF_000112200 [Pleodorina starrii]
MQSTLSLAGLSSLRVCLRTAHQLVEHCTRLSIHSCTHQGHCATDNTHHPPTSSSSSSPLPCGKGDNRTRRGKIFRNTFREHLPRQWLHPEQFPGGPAFHRPGEHGWRQERFRYPGEPTPPPPPAAPSAAAAAALPAALP